jgi:hypothetical protein
MRTYRVVVLRPVQVRQNPSTLPNVSVEPVLYQKLALDGYHQPQCCPMQDHMLKKVLRNDVFETMII